MSFNLNKFEKLRTYWCQKVIPLVYDESLSYYEFLCKLMERLNSFVDTVNELIDIAEDHEERLDVLESWKTTIETWKTTIQTQINNIIDGTTPITLPIASATRLGGVKIGEGVTVQSDGTISVSGGGGTPYVLPTMSASTKGGARLGSGLNITDTDKLGVDSANLDLSTNTSITTLTTSVNNIIDGTTEIDISENETITKIVDGTTPVPSSYALPTMASDTKGGAKLGTGLAVANDTLSVDVANLDLSTNSTITNIIDGTTEIDISENSTIENIIDGTTPVPSSYTLPTMSSSTKGGAKVGSGLSVANDTLSVNTNVVATNEKVTTIRESLNDVIGTEAPTGTSPINFVTLTGEQPPTEQHPEYDHYGYFVCHDLYKGYCLTEIWWKNNGLDNLDFRVVLSSSSRYNPPTLAFKCTRTSSSSNTISVLLKTYDTSGTLLVSETKTIIPADYSDFNYTDYYVTFGTYTGSPLWLASGDLMVGVGDGCSSILPVTLSRGGSSTEVTLKPNTFAYTINGFVPLTPYQLLTNNVTSLSNTLNSRVAVNVPQSTETSYPTVTEFNALLTALKNAGLMVADS